MFRTFLCALAVASSAGAVLADEAGTLTLDIAGETHSFTLWAHQSDWSGSETYASVNIYARPETDATREAYGILTLGFEVAGGSANAPEASLTRIDGDERVKLYSTDDAGGLSITPDIASVSGEELTVSGSFAGEMGISENYGRDIDLNDPLAVSGTFDVVLGPVE
ncbi:hypothetical protein [uncultured Maritimibacter sp.]|uniref:hypothetical protein n=1 Tax=uncultured Maritimibacter sp. TaxID=991866 RepID=UPI002599025F|nr:hypothetical protein [uncultured Maritimibacter sp.]